MSDNDRFNPPPVFPFHVGYRVRTTDNRYGYIQRIYRKDDGLDYAEVNSEKWDWAEMDVPLNMLRPANLHYSPATQTEPEEIDGEYNDDNLSF
jgi:hypothetical protein